MRVALGHVVWDCDKCFYNSAMDLWDLSGGKDNWKDWNCLSFQSSDIYFEKHISIRVFYEDDKYMFDLYKKVITNGYLFIRNPKKDGFKIYLEGREITNESAYNLEID